MDADRFDTLARALLPASSRRALLGFGLGGVLPALRREAERADHLGEDGQEWLPPEQRKD